MTVIKILFAVGQCVRLLNTDPWQAATFKITDVGRFSYRAEKVVDYSNDAMPWINNKIIIFKGEYKEIPDQTWYETVPCPGETKP